MKIISWNVNGLRSLLKREYLQDFIDNEDPDIFCMGETKLSCPNDKIDAEITIKFPQFKYKYWGDCYKKGYSGTCIFCKKKPINIIYGLKYNDEEIDKEGRVIVVEYPKFYLLHVYTPNSGQVLTRLDWRTTVWDRAFELYVNKLQKNKPIIICGDLNVAHNEIDLKNPKSNKRNAGYTIEERNSFNSILDNCNLIDSYRKLNPDKIEYSYWSYMRNSRLNNSGWRIDYFLIDKRMYKKVNESSICTGILGSDHAPIKLMIN